MTLNSITFLIFLVGLWLIHWLIPFKHRRWQNGLLFAASYLYYALWDWRFLGLIAVISATLYGTGLAMESEKREGRRKLLLAVSLIVTLGSLIVLKYTNFFLGSLFDLLRLLGITANPITLGIVVPIGISFFTLMAATYPIEVYRRNMPATRSWLDFFTFVAFFPQILSGPIERAHNLLPQYATTRVFNSKLDKDGLRLILWGLVLKVIFSDNIGPVVAAIYGSPESQGSLGVLTGMFLFTIQIYCDFAGYSAIAVGVAKLFGIQLMLNFAFPFFSRDVGEFWRRWHISLSTWLRDYVQYSLPGNYGSKLERFRNIMITFAVSGLWHGTAWTYVFWGLLNGLYFVPMLLNNNPQKKSKYVAKGKVLPSLDELWRLALTFSAVMFAFHFFRANTISDAFVMLGQLVTQPQLELKQSVWPLLAGSALLLVIEWFQRSRHHTLELDKLPTAVRWVCYFSLVTAILVFGKTSTSQFIYFQF